MVNSEFKMATKFPDEFHLESYFNKHEFSVSRLLCVSDSESITINEIIRLCGDGEEFRETILSLPLGYGKSDGDEELLEEIVKLYPGLTKKGIMEVVPVEGIYIGLRCIAKLLTDKYKNEEIHAISMFPCYQSLSEILPLSGISLTHWHMEVCPETNQWIFSMKTLKENVLKSNTRVIVVNLPHNPTGYLPTKEWLNELVELCRERDIFLFSDEIYRFIVHDDYQQLPPVCSLYENSLTMSGLSKCFGVPGIRCGWLATQHSELYELIVKYKCYTTICANVLGEKVALTILKHKETILKRQRSITQDNLNFLDQFCQRHSDKFIWRRPTASTTALLELSEQFLKQVGSATKFCDYLLKMDILLLPSSTMLMSDDKHVRIGYGRKNFQNNLQNLEEVLKKMPDVI